MRKLISPVITAIICTAIAIACLSCGSKPIGYGIVLWSPDEERLATGNLIPVLEESEIEDTYTLVLNEEENMAVTKWRIEFFDNKKEAEAYADRRSEYLRMIASAKIDGLAVREETDNLTRRLYKLRKSEVVKVIDRSGEKAQIGDYEDYWYKVVTKDGTEGWCYGESLIIREIGAEGRQEQAQTDIDAGLAAFLDNVWRPEYFRTYIDDGTFDLEEFRADIGIFPNQEEKTILHVTKKRTTEYSYTEIIDAGGNLFLFKGTPVKVKIYTPERIMFEYLENGKSVQKLYLKIDEDIEELVKQEQERRWQVYEALTKNGSIFTSEAYGTIEFINFTKFRWKDYDRLVPNVIPAGMKDNTGKLEFSLFLGNGLKQNYDGALLLIFSEKKEAPISLLFTMLDGGIQFTYAPPSTRAGVVIEREPTAPIVMFFSVQEE